MQPDIARAILRAFRIIRESLSESQLARIISTGSLPDDIAIRLDMLKLAAAEMAENETVVASDPKKQDIPPAKTPADRTPGKTPPPEDDPEDLPAAA